MSNNKTASETQIEQLHNRAINDVTREIGQSGIHLTWPQADDLGQECLDWMRSRLGLYASTDDAGIDFRNQCGRTR